jgi:hypothetical protein
LEGLVIEIDLKESTPPATETSFRRPLFRAGGSHPFTQLPEGQLGN